MALPTSSSRTARSAPAGRAARLRRIARALIAPLAAGLVVAAATPAAAAPATAAARQVAITIDPFDPGPPVPARFLGLSFEAAAIGEISRYGGRGDLVEMLRSLGPGMLRFGGITADENVAWTDPGTPRPAWATSVIGPAQMQALGSLARRSGWQVLLTVGLAHYEPAAAAREVAAAHAALGPYLAAVEVGNEPNAYASHGFRELPWVAQGYEEEVSAYRAAIETLTPGIPIAGPDVSGSGVFPEWGGAEALSQAPALLTGHHYPLGCAQTPAPTIEALLSSADRRREEQSLATYTSVSRAQGIPMRIDEAGSVSCGGVPGISDTFASALWATGYITQVMAAGTAGINLQGNPANCVGYTPVCAPDASDLAQGVLRAQPDWYALLLTRSLPGDRPLPTSIAGEGTPDVVAASFAERDHSLAVVLVNDEPAGTAPLALRVGLGVSMGPAQVLRLTAASPSATGGVLLAARAVAPDGSWRAPAQIPTTATHAGVLAVTLPPDSAALVTVRAPRPRPHRRTAHRHS